MWFAILIGLLMTATAAAETRSPTCDKLQAQARSEAVILYAPRIEIVGARTPSVIGPDDPTSSIGEGLQARLALAVSPVDMLRGRAIERVASAECVRDHLAQQIARLLAVGTRYGELASIQAELEVLDQHMPELDVLVQDATARFERQRATAIEVDDVREQRSVLRLRASELRHTRDLLEELDGPALAQSALAELSGAYRVAALEVDHRQGDMRTLSAWTFEVRGGVSGGERADWFAMVEIGYSLGGPLQGKANRQALRARGAELATDDREVAVRLDQLRRAMQRSLKTLEVELAVLDEDLAFLRIERDRVEDNSSDAARQLRARVAIRIIVIEARRASVASLAAARRPLAGELK